MEIKIRKINSLYKEIEIKDYNTILNLGLLDEEERLDLIEKFQDAINLLKE